MMRLVGEGLVPVTANDYINVEGLTFWYKDVPEPAIRDVDLKVTKGEFACIVGPSGCGKSTLLSILSGLFTPQRGSVTIDGKTFFSDGKRAVSDLPPCGYVFQDARLLPWRTVSQNIALAMKAAGIPKSTWKEGIRSHLRMLRLESYENAWPLNLSGGQRARVAIARALAVQPAFILMDEPFSTLDEVTGRFLRSELLELWERTGATIVFVTHSLREAVYLSDHIYLMTAGPGEIFDKHTVELPRPRKYEDPRITEIEGALVNTVLERWGYHEDNLPT
jgi:NitT/TauT family transport system ATP-binding protein